ncbi:PstS family phosphate ABC transporter substrate-binding protein [Arcticibacter sp.]|uniref:PstS family phosphate ABC transporter substrate-binding protein n=1 Tax=Arcticibacter sp. TaxID=1872630 RepID=UPI00389002E2
MKHLLGPILLIFLAACGGENRAIKVKGSDTEVNLAVSLAEAFYRVNDDFSLAISGGGSGLGIASIINGQADIANSSRPLSKSEIALFKEKGIKIRTVVFAEDATAIIVNKSFPMDSIDVATLGKIFDGTYKSWKPVTGQDIPVTLYGRQSNSGTHSFIKKKLDIRFSDEAKEMNGSAQIMGSVKSDHTGIGYIGAGYLLQNAEQLAVKALKIYEKAGDPAVSPMDRKAILEGRYFLQRPLYQFIPEESWEKVSAFIDFEKSAKGQEIIQDSGYYIVND